MNRRPLVSIVMPVYDAAATVEEAGRSLLTQTYQPLEIVVIDDGSHDRSAEIVRGLGDPRLKIVRQEHRGLVPALVRGCAEAEGEYVARLDADDITYPERIAAQTAYLEKHGEIGLLGTWASLCDEDGRTWSFEPPPNDAALRRYLLRDNPFVHSTVMFRKQAYGDAGGYADGPNEDYRLWIRMARAWKIAILPDVLVMHRVRRASHSGSMPRSAALRARLAAQWDAARLLGPWSGAIPTLAATCGTYALSMLGGAPERWVRSRARGRGASRAG
jgi:glycosyltransferase involved in cell wall biosynthesis